jgi:hypothetical protein
MVPYLAWKNICRSDIRVYIVPNVGSLSEHMNGNFDGVVLWTSLSSLLYCQTSSTLVHVFFSWKSGYEAA